MCWHGLLKPPKNIKWTVKSELGHMISDMNTVVEVTNLKLVSLGQARGNESRLALASAWSIGTFTCSGSSPYLKVVFVFCGAAAQRGPWPPHFWGFLITHNDASQSVGLLWTRDQLVAETSTWHHITLTTDKHPCPRWDSNPRSQQASGRWPTS